MKNLYAAATLWCVLFIPFISFAQVEPPLNQQIPDKPFLFANLPEKIECDIEELKKLFHLSTSKYCKLELKEGLVFGGVLSRRVLPNKYLASINIQLENYESAFLTLSRISDDKGVIKYTGRIISVRSGDLLLLKQEKEKYFFVKQESRFVMVE
jgi:hypothetical protein